MLNENKIKLMTKLAAYEKNTGKKTMKIARYFRSDYISWNIIKTIFAVTVAYLGMLGVWFLYHLEQYIEEMYSLDYLALGKQALRWYLILLAVYVVIAFVFYNIKYTLAQKSLKRFRNTLKRVEKTDTPDRKGRE